MISTSPGGRLAFHRAATGPNNVVVPRPERDHDRLVASSSDAREAAAPHGSRPPGLSCAAEAVLRFQANRPCSVPRLLSARASRARPPALPASILDGVLGGSASSRLFQEIREKRGLAYAVYTFSSQYADTGQMGIYVGTREENLADCLRIATEQIGDIAEHGPRPGELERAKENLKGRIMPRWRRLDGEPSRESAHPDSELLDIDRYCGDRAVANDPWPRLAR